MKESLWRLYGGLYTFVSTTRCLSRPLYLNRADDNIFRIIVYCRPKRQTIQLSRKPFFGRNVVTLQFESHALSFESSATKYFLAPLNIFVEFRMTFLNLKCGRCLLSSGIPEGKSWLFRKMSIKHQKWPGLSGSCCRLLIPGNCARALFEVVNFIKYEILYDMVYINS